ncbi:MAG: Mrp/NBP35 family ATP-binding protein [Alphaproteobacteria bacterium]|nr:Mrp/NBP35 family ATP-binding protein [Alphaproteobacteria bacterium]
MAKVSEKDVLAALGELKDPVGGQDIVGQGMVSRPVLRDGTVAFAIQVPADQAARAGDEWEPLRRAAETAVRALPGVSQVSAVLTADRPPPTRPEPKPAPSSTPPTAPDPKGGGPAPGMRSSDMLAGVRHVVAVASGKGGVGKSTTAINLALAFKAQGRTVGLLDADIYGPSLPRMTGIDDQPKSTEDKKILPLEKWGLELMSIGFMIAPETPMIWRGPMVMGALEQFMRDVEWGITTKNGGQENQGLDIVVVDMPPGTGDIALTLTQRVPVAGAVIVSTTQDIALIDAVKAVNMFRKVDVPILGLIENMSYFACPHCGERTDIFGHGGAADEARRLKVDFLGEIPLHADIRATSDAGQPVVVSATDGPHAQAYLEIARKAAAKLGL